MVGRDAFLDMVDMSADADLGPLLGRQRNWPRNRCGMGIIQCSAEIEAVIRRYSGAVGGRVGFLPVLWGKKILSSYSTCSVVKKPGIICKAPLTCKANFTIICTVYFTLEVV